MSENLEGVLNMDKRMAALESNIAGLNVSVQTLTQTMQAVVSRMDKFDHAIQSMVRMEERNASHKSAIDRAFNRLDDLSQRLTQHEDADASTHVQDGRRVDGLEKEIIAAKSFVRGVVWAGGLAWVTLGGIMVWIMGRLGELISLSVQIPK